jgi:UDP-N-acetylglucosamine--N-acetylmuramyl-(pentapeptide) pyrophosphoryl-undecaprenol N-acetylglucosamine transferase
VNLNRPKRILFTGGGTGGHIYPAVAIAREVQRLAPDTEILFVGALGKMEMEKVPRAGFEIVGLPVSAFHRSLTLKNLLFPYKLLMSLLKARRVVRDFNPDLVVGTGGFASGPVLRVSTQKHIPVILQEQNAFPGVTNRLVAGKVNHICVAYPGMEKYFPGDKIVVTGNPVRTDLVLPADRLAAAYESFGFNREIPVILIFGGSLGARTLNHCMAAAAGRLAGEPVQIIWQTGTGFLPEAKASVEQAGAKNIRVHDFIYNMDEAYAIAALAVCRAGAITLSELAVVGKPALLVPFPAAAEDHQTKNARVFTGAGAALLITDAEAGNKLINKMMELIGDKQALAEMAKNMSTLAKPDATSTIANLALKLLTSYS